MDYSVFKVKAKSAGKTYISFSADVEPETVEQINELKARGYDIKGAVKTLVEDMHKNVISLKK